MTDTSFNSDQPAGLAVVPCEQKPFYPVLIKLYANSSSFRLQYDTFIIERSG